MAIVIVFCLQMVVCCVEALEGGFAIGNLHPDRFVLSLPVGGVRSKSIEAVEQFLMTLEGRRSLGFGDT